MVGPGAEPSTMKYGVAHLVPEASSAAGRTPGPRKIPRNQARSRKAGEDTPEKDDRIFLPASRGARSGPTLKLIPVGILLSIGEKVVFAGNKLDLLEIVPGSILEKGLYCLAGHLAGKLHGRIVNFLLEDSNLAVR